MKKFLKLSLVCLLTLLLLPLGHVEAQDDGKVNVLLLGLDAGYEVDREEDTAGSRSDAIMILTLDDASNSLTISTIPRDSYVDIPGHGMDKVNHAHAYGGVDLTIETLENWLGTDFDYYVTSNMPGYVEMVNLLGGLKVVPPSTFNWWETHYFEEGVEQEVNGDEALAYARERFTSGGDYARQGRMREMMTVIINMLSAEGDLEQYRSDFENRYEYIQTDASFDDILNLFEKYQAGDYDIVEFQLMGEGQNDPNAGYIDLTDENSLEELKAILN